MKIVKKLIFWEKCIILLFTEIRFSEIKKEGARAKRTGKRVFWIYASG